MRYILVLSMLLAMVCSLAAQADEPVGAYSCLTARLIQNPPHPAPPVRPLPRPTSPLTRDFWTINSTSTGYVSVTADQRAEGRTCIIYVDQAISLDSVNDAELATLVKVMDDSTKNNPRIGIVQSDTAHFGPMPDIDGNGKVIILVLDIRFAANGYFSGTDEDAADPYSNVADMIYLDWRPGGRRVATSYGFATLAHELQHMISSIRHGSGEELWVNEGCAELARFICGWLSPFYLETYFGNPNTDMTSFSGDVDYPKTFLFMLYFYNNYGDDMLRLFMDNDLVGIQRFDMIFLAASGEMNFQTFFADYATALWVRDTVNFDGKYGFRGIDLSSFDVTLSFTIRTYPFVDASGRAYNWAVNYVRFDEAIPMLWLYFAGTSPAAFKVRAIRVASDTMAIDEIPLNEDQEGSVTLPGMGDIFDYVIMVVCKVGSVGRTEYYYTADQRVGVESTPLASAEVAPRVFPNPARDRVTLELPGTSVWNGEVVDLLGHALMHFDRQVGDLDLSSLPQGVSWVRVRNESGTEWKLPVVRE